MCFIMQSTLYCRIWGDYFYVLVVLQIPPHPTLLQCTSAHYLSIPHFPCPSTFPEIPSLCLHGGSLLLFQSPAIYFFTSPPAFFPSLFPNPSSVSAACVCSFHQISLKAAKAGQTEKPQTQNCNSIKLKPMMKY